MTNERSEAARLLGSVRSPAKTARALAGSKRSAELRTKTPREAGCTCPPPTCESTAYADHLAGCPAYRVLYQREKQRERRARK